MLRRILIGAGIGAGALLLMFAGLYGWSRLPPSGPGAHFVFEADFPAYWRGVAPLARRAIARSLTRNRIGFALDGDTIRLTESSQLGTATLLAGAAEAGFKVNASANDTLAIAPDPEARAQIEPRLMGIAAAVLQRRADLLSKGWGHADVTGDRIAVGLKGGASLDGAEKFLTLPVAFGIYAVDDNLSIDDLRRRQAPAGERVLDSHGGGEGVAVSGRALVDDSQVADAQASFDAEGHPALNIRFDADGARAVARATATHIGHRLAIVLNGIVLASPYVNEPITQGTIQISGDLTPRYSEEVADLLRAGALPMPLTLVSAAPGEE